MEYCLAYVLKWDCKRALYFNWKIKSIAETTHYLTFILMMFPRKRPFSTFLIIWCHFDIFPHLWGWNRFFFNHPLVVTVSTIIEKKTWKYFVIENFRILKKFLPNIIWDILSPFCRRILVPAPLHLVDPTPVQGPAVLVLTPSN